MHTPARLEAQLTTEARTWLEAYVDHLKKMLGPELRRVVVYGSTARGDATAESDLDVLVLVTDEHGTGSRATVMDVMNAAWDAPCAYEAKHSVEACSEHDWQKSLEREMPFQRNVEAEGIQVHPDYRPPAGAPGERPPVTSKGIRNAVPQWLENARQRLEDLKFEKKLVDEGSPGIGSGLAQRQAFDAVFFSTMAWCLTSGVSVVQRRKLAEIVETHLIEPGLVEADWRPRIEELARDVNMEEYARGRRSGDAGAQVERWQGWAQTFHAITCHAMRAQNIEIQADTADQGEQRR